MNGDFVDVSNIPTAAIERIEILPDGASALYGSDAIAGVVNIILRDDFQGAETQVKYGGTPGGRDETVVSQLLGTHWDSGKAMLVYEYSDGTPLDASARGYAANTDKRPYGGADYRSFYSYPGNILDPNTLQPILRHYPVRTFIDHQPSEYLRTISTVLAENPAQRLCDRLTASRAITSSYSRRDGLRSVVPMYSTPRKI